MELACVCRIFEACCDTGLYCGARIVVEYDEVECVGFYDFE